MRARFPLRMFLASCAFALCSFVSAPALDPGAGGPPATARDPVTEIYFDVSVKDDYRWLENWSDPSVQKWSETQNAYARSVLDHLPNVAEIRQRVRRLAAFPAPQYFGFVYRGGTLFAMKDEPPKQQPFLVVLKSLDEPGSERTLVDPNKLDPRGTTAIDFYTPSLDGRLVAVSLSEGGSENGNVHVYETGTGRELADVIPRVNGGTAGGDLAWSADGGGFYYTRYPRGQERPPADLAFYQQVYFHRIGTPTGEDAYSLGRDFPRIAETTLAASRDGRFLLASVKNGDGGEVAQFLRTLEGSWKQVAGFTDEAVFGEFGPDGALYLLSRKGTPRGKILRLSAGASALDQAETVVAETEGVISGFRVAGSRLYVAEILGGPSRIRVFDRDGHAEGDLPILPVSSVGEMLALDGDELLFSNQSYLEPAAWFRAGTGRRVTRTTLAKASLADYSDTEVVRELAVSRDGTRIPLNIIRRKGTPLDGHNPVVLYGYGGYGISETPYFSDVRRVWIEQGGVYAIANLRGGGEFGEQWHQAGKLTRKQNVFDDFLACARRLIELHYTNPDRLAIRGGSNGGLLMGAALTQHPELFRAVVSSVGIYDSLRFELSSNGEFNVTEFGTVKDPEQFKALYAYSPYHHVVDGARYPAVLFLTGANDPRVDPMNSRKMTARLQAASTSGLPVLLRTSSSAGHGIGSSLDEEIGQAVDAYAFLFHELGVAYRPVTR